MFRARSKSWILLGVTPKLKTKQTKAQNLVYCCEISNGGRNELAQTLPREGRDLWTWGTRSYGISIAEEQSENCRTPMAQGRHMYIGSLHQVLVSMEWTSLPHLCVHEENMELQITKVTCLGQWHHLDYKANYRLKHGPSMLYPVRFVKNNLPKAGMCASMPCGILACELMCIFLETLGDPGLNFILLKTKDLQRK